MNQFKLIRLLVCFCVVAGVGVMSGCGFVSDTFQNFFSAVGFWDDGTVISTRAQIRSSYSVVASDQLEVKRGQTLDILEEYEYEKVRWYRVRAYDDDRTEGWIEAQHVITGSVLEKSREIAEKDKNIQSLATAKLLSASNLRLSPEQKPDNIILKLDKNSVFEIVEWKMVPKPADDSSKNENDKRTPTTRNEEIEAAREENQEEDLNDKYDFWYRVRINPSVSPAPAGWLFGGQVELQVPSEIAFYQNESRKFVSWKRLDSSDVADVTTSSDGTQTTKPGNWVVLARSTVAHSKDGNEPDFDMILVLGYDKYREEYYTAYRQPDVWGKIPLRVDGPMDSRAFTVLLRNANGEMEEKRFVTFRDQKGRLRLNPPDVYVEKKDEKNATR